MKQRDLAELLLLGALWGASFLFMRLGAVDFGPLALVFVRVAGAALLLLPWLALQGHLGALRRHWRPIAVVGLLNSALPFAFFTMAALVLSAGA
jgi:drug/metabolite transporter (DMT)-like permease